MSQANYKCGWSLDNLAPVKVLGPALVPQPPVPCTPYRYYVILHLRSTKVASVEEIVQVGLVVVDAVTFDEVFAFESLVKPSILNTISSTTSRTIGCNVDELYFDFSHVLEFILRDLEWALKDEEALLITLGNRHLQTLFRGQIMIECALGKMGRLCENTEWLEFFTVYCNLEDSFFAKYGIRLPSKPLRGFQDHLEYIYFYLKLNFDEALRAPARSVDRALAIVPLLKCMASKERPLYPNTKYSISLPSTAQSVTSSTSLPTLCDGGKEDDRDINSE